MGIIYCYTNRITGKKYIGQTIHPDQRKRNHLHEATMKNSDYYFHRSIRKHGIENFTYEILEEMENPDELIIRERHYVETLNTIWPNGYNEVLPLNIMSDEIRQKISESQKKRLAARTPEQISMENAKRSKSMMGHKQSQHQKDTATKTFSQFWSITHPCGKQESIHNLLEFCRTVSDNPSSMSSNLYKYGKHKGFKAHKIPTSSTNI